MCEEERKGIRQKEGETIERENGISDLDLATLTLLT